MKTLTYIFTLFVLLSCEKHEFPSTKLTYPFEPEQELIINVDVIPVGDVEMELIDMELEVNADYYNRYGIGVRLNLMERTKLEYPLPNTEKDKITVYVVPMEYVEKYKGPGTAAYTIFYRMVSGTMATIILGEDFQTNKSLAHEIVHTFGMPDHNHIKNNIMNLSAKAWQYDIPNNFTEEQIETIKENMVWYELNL